MLRHVALVSFAALALGALGCGSSPQQQCKDIVAATCNKVFTCYTGADLDAIKESGIFGTTEAECTTKLTTSANCEKAEPCDTGKTYDGSAAGTCINDMKALSCTDLKAGQTPSSCDDAKICK